ncbi:MAG: GbsR/MarR family transcriptional regulator [Candidatus Spyradosoma sp.]
MSNRNDRKEEAPLPLLAAWELAVVEVFCRGAAMLGLRKSVGMVYGALYCSDEPLAITDLQEKLLLSRGACVEATQLLRRFGAVRVVIRLGERKDFFEAETDLKKFAAGALHEILLPGIEKTSLRLEHAATLARGTAAKTKIAKLRAAKDALSSLVPAVEKILG